MHSSWRKIWIFLFFAGVTVCAVGLHAQTDAPELSADEPISFDAANEVLVASGNATFRDKELVIVADRITFSRETSELRATGHVIITRPEIRLLTEWAEYNVETRAFAAGPFRAGVPPAFVEGEGFAGTPETLNVEDATIFYGEPERWAPRVSARTVTILPGERIRADGVRLGLIDGLNVPAPSFDRSLDVPPVDFNFRVGYRPNLGAFLQTETLFPVGERLGVGANLDFYTNRGVLLGPRLVWQAETDDGFQILEVDTGWIADQNADERGLDVRNREIDVQRGFAGWRLTAADDRFYLTSRGMLTSDSEMLRDFRDDLDNAQPQPFAWADAGWSDGLWTFSLYAQSNVNRDFAGIERWPEITLDRAPTELGTSGIWQQGQVSYSRLRRGQSIFPGLPGLPFSFETTAWEDHVSGTYSLQRPIALTRWLTLTPRAEMRWAHLSQDGIEHERVQASFGFDLRARIFARSNYQNDVWRINGLRHRSHFLLQHRWQPRLDDDAMGLGSTLTDYFIRGTAITPLNLLDQRAMRGVIEPHTIRLGWENWLETRDLSAPGGVRRLISWSLYQDYQIERVASPIFMPGGMGGMAFVPEKEPSWEATYAALRASPASWLEFALEGRLDTTDFQVDEGRFVTRVRSGEIWGFDLTADFLRAGSVAAPELEQYSAFGYYWIFDDTALVGGARYDAVLSDWTRQRIGVRHRLGRSWEIEIALEWREGDSREDTVGVSLAVDLVRF